MPSESRLCINGADCSSYGEYQGLREVYSATVDDLSKALDSRTSYFHAFEIEGKGDVSTYKETQKNRKGIENPLNLVVAKKQVLQENSSLEEHKFGPISILEQHLQ